MFSSSTSSIWNYLSAEKWFKAKIVQYIVYMKTKNIAKHSTHSKLPVTPVKRALLASLGATDSGSRNPDFKMEKWLSSATKFQKEMR